MSSQFAIRQFVLQARLGMIPDPQEDFLSIAAIAAILGREDTTIANKLPRSKIERHPLGPYFRLSDALKVMNATEEDHS
jgi:hypothetical protein